MDYRPFPKPNTECQVCGKPIVRYENEAHICSDECAKKIKFTSPEVEIARSGRYENADLQTIAVRAALIAQRRRNKRLNIYLNGEVIAYPEMSGAGAYLNT